MTSVLGILAVGGGSQSADPPGDWGMALIVMGTLVVTFFVAMLVVERIDVRIELNRWLRTFMASQRRRQEPPDRPEHVDEEH